MGQIPTWTNLDSLYLHENEIGDAGASIIGSNVAWENLRELTLGRNNISDKGAIAIGSNET